MENRIVFLDGPGFYFRPPEEADLPLFTRWMNDPEVRIYLGRNFAPMMLNGEKEWFAERHKRMEADPILVLVDKENDKAIGTFGIHGIDFRNGTATSGACIGEKEYWGKGIGTKAKMVLLKHAFHMLNVRKIYSHVFDFNGRSRRYSEKCGYKLEAVLKNHHFRNGKRVDEHILSITVDTWRKLRSK